MMNWLSDGSRQLPMLSKASNSILQKPGQGKIISERKEGTSSWVFPASKTILPFAQSQQGLFSMCSVFPPDRMSAKGIAGNRQLRWLHRVGISGAPPRPPRREAWH